MPRKKSKNSSSKKPGKARSGQPKGKQLSFGGGGAANALSLLAEMVGELTEDERLGLMSAMLGGPVDPSLLEIPRKTSPAIRLVEKSKSLPSAREAVAILQEAVEVARKALGKKLEQNAGRLGDTEKGLDLIEAKAELAIALSAAGNESESLAQAEEAFRLDPEDPCDVRTTLLQGYFNAGRVDDADRLLSEHCPEPWTPWFYGRLLILLRRGERGPAAQSQLQAAYRANPYVLAHLLGERIIGPGRPPSIEPGDEGEAQDYAAYFLPAWRDTPGAVRWLREAAGRLGLDIALPEDEPEEPLDPFDAVNLPPHKHETWIVGQYQTPPLKMEGKGRAKRQWLLFAFSPQGEEIEFDFRDRKTPDKDLWGFLHGIMQHSLPPGRPRKLLLYADKVPARLRILASMAGIETEVYDQRDRLTELLEHLCTRMQGSAAAAQALPVGAIAELPLDPDEVWEAAVVQLAQRIDVRGQSLRPWVSLVLSREGLILWHDLSFEQPNPGALAAAVRMAMAMPAAGDPRRPRHILVRDADDALGLRELSAEAGFTSEIAPELPALQEALASLTEKVLGGEPPVVLCRIEGLAQAELERYFAVAADYFRAQPWKRFAMDEVVALDAATLQMPRRYALVMGQSGIATGMAVYDQLEQIQDTFANPTAPMRDDMAGFSVMFGEEEELAAADVDAIEQFGWPVATPEAFPSVFRVLPGPKVEAPTAEELRYLTAALEGVARLAKTGQPKTTVCAPGVSLELTRLGPVDQL